MRHCATLKNLLLGGVLTSGSTSSRPHCGDESEGSMSQPMSCLLTGDRVEFFKLYANVEAEPGRAGSAWILTVKPHYTRIAWNRLAANSASIHFLWDTSNSLCKACWDCSQRGASLRRGLAPLQHLHKVKTILLYANARGVNPRGHQSANRTWVWAMLSMLVK